MRPWRRVPRLVWLLLALALVVRLGFLAATPNYDPVHDDRDYDRLACALVQGGGYPAVGPAASASSCGSPGPSPRTAFRPPGYPLFLSTVYAVAKPLPLGRRVVARVVQALIGTVAVALMGLIAWRLWGRRAGVAALAVASVHLPLIVLGGSLLSETLFVALELGALAAVIEHRRGGERHRWLVLAGALAGFGVLARTNGAWLLPPLALAVWTVRPRLSARALAAPALLVGVAALVVVPWTVRNAVAMDDFVPVNTEAGSALAGTYNDRARDDPRLPGAWRPPARLQQIQPILRRGLPEPAEQRELVRASLRYMADNPGYVAEVGARNTARLFGFSGRDWWRFTARTQSMPAAVGDIAAAGFFVVLALALVGAFTAAARRAPAWFWAIPPLFVVSVEFIAGETRFRAPIEPFVVLLAALGATHLAERLGRTRAAGT